MQGTEFILDFTPLQTLTGDDNEFMIEILELIVEQSPDVLTAMQEQLNQNDFASLSSTAHKYKSSINILGNVELLNIVHALESKAIAQPPKEELVGLVTDFEQMCDQLLTAIQAKLADLKLAA